MWQPKPKREWWFTKQRNKMKEENNKVAGVFGLSMPFILVVVVLGVVLYNTK